MASENQPRTVHFEAGDLVIEEGQIGNGLYVLMSGMLEVLQEGVRITTISQKGSFVGEISSILGCSCVATVRAMVPSDLLLVEKVTEYMQKNANTALMLAQTLAARIMDMNRKFLALQKRVEELSSKAGERIGEEALGSIGKSLTEIHRIVAANPEEKKR